MNLREAAEKGLEALEYATRCAAMVECERAAELLRAALAQAEEPAAWQCRTRPTWGNRHGLEEKPWSPWEFCSKEVAEDCWRVPFLNDWAYEARALYAHPRRREPLTVEAIDALTERVEFLFGFSDDWAVHFARAIERAHGIGGEK